MLYDTHSHPYLAKEKSQEFVLENFFTNWWKHLNSVGCDIESSEICIDLAIKNPGVYATIWIHPTHTLDYKDSLNETILKLEELYHKNSSIIVAIWEIWLDYHWLEVLSKKYGVEQEKVIEIQKIYFTAQIELAKKLDLPIIIHNRNSSADVLDILTRAKCTNFIFHCYSEDYEYAQKLLTIAPDCMLGFWGVTTFKSASLIQEATRKVPLRNIIIETDSPYLTPTPYRGKEENEPLFCKQVLSKIIDLRHESSQEITKQIFENSKRAFSIQ